MEKKKRPKIKCGNCGCLKSKTTARLIKNNEYLIREAYCTNCGHLKYTIKTELNNDSGKYVSLTINRKRTWMHRFIYELYHNVKLTPYDTIHHVDCVKSNNTPGNLLLTTHRNPLYA